MCYHEKKHILPNYLFFQCFSAANRQLKYLRSVCQNLVGSESGVQASDLLNLKPSVSPEAAASLTILKTFNRPPTYNHQFIQYLFILENIHLF